MRTLLLRSDRARRWGKYPAEVKTRSRGRLIGVDHSSPKGSDTPSFICGSSGPINSDESKPNILMRRGPGLVLVVTVVSGANQCILVDVDPVKGVARGCPMKRVPHVFIDSSAFKEVDASVPQVVERIHGVIARSEEDLSRVLFTRRVTCPHM